MVKRYEYVPIYVVVRLDRFRRQGLRADHYVTTIEALPTLAEAWAERDRLNALAHGRGIGAEYIASTCRWYPEGRGAVPSSEQSAVIAGTWVWPENVQAVLETLSRWIGYDFDASDWIAVEHGLLRTSEDDDRWFDYPLVGQVRLDVELAQALGADPVTIRVRSETDLSDELRIRIATGLEVLNCYRVSMPRPTA